MFSDQAATLKPGDWLEYELSRERQDNGTIIITTVPCEFVKPGSSPHRIVVRPEFTDPRWNRARSVGISKINVIAQFHAIAEYREVS